MLKCPDCGYYNSKEDLNEGTINTRGLVLKTSVEDILNIYNKSSIRIAFGCNMCHTIIHTDYKKIFETFNTNNTKFVIEY